MVAFQEKVATFHHEAEATTNVINRGSDEHLDFIISIKPKIQSLTANLNNFLLEIIPLSNTSPLEDIQSGMLDLKDIYRQLLQLIARMHDCGLYNDIKATARALTHGTENLREFIYDLEHYRIHPDAELEELLAGK
ncbi:hypothetical protein [Flaviaesturariibacter amylovorans]|uniref:Uncharacterized protein n=1 Tax=Flaviaesturariibacter amylovorans TaxID=1084520 RepID=A0ABP8GPI0_9BACT